MRIRIRWICQRSSSRIFILTTGSGRSQLKESTTLCPLCHKPFPYSQIVEHAEHCRGVETITVPDNDSSRKTSDQLCECPICHKMFDIFDIVDHTERCGKIPAPKRREPSPPRRDPFVCPFCQRMDFDTEAQYLSHMTECQNPSSNPSRRRDVYASNNDRGKTSSQGSDSAMLSECPFCGRFTTDDPIELQNHINKCPAANERTGSERKKRFVLFSRH